MSKEFYVVAPEKIEFREYEEQPLQSGEARIKSILSGISHGTELNLYRGTSPFASKVFDPEYRMFLPGEGNLSFPLQLGYEMVGEVVEVGPNVNGLVVGSLVHGYLRHRETNVAKADRLMPLPRGMKPEQAVFFALGVVALNAIHDARIKVGDEVAVFGLGVIGLIAIQLAKLSGASLVYAIDNYPKRCETGKKVGADQVFNAKECDPAYEIKKASSQKGVDVAIECAGHYDALSGAIRSVRMGGDVVTVGYYQGEPLSLDLGAEWHHNRLSMRSSMGVWGCPNRNYPLWDYERLRITMLSLLDKRKVATDGFITHEFPFLRVQAAYKLISEHPEDTIKIVLRYVQD